MWHAKLINQLNSYKHHCIKYNLSSNIIILISIVSCQEHSEFSFGINSSMNMYQVHGRTRVTRTDLACRLAHQSKLITANSTPIYPFRMTATLIRISQQRMCRVNSQIRFSRRRCLPLQDYHFNNQAQCVYKPDMYMPRDFSQLSNLSIRSYI